MFPSERLALGRLFCAFRQPMLALFPNVAQRACRIPSQKVELTHLCAMQRHKRRRSGDGVAWVDALAALVSHHNPRPLTDVH
ncbi:hypothetical protein GCM10017643_04390 [Ancylobacter dichloromethanicus]|uniref:Transposase n=1 Tax=Ancylobacter dichloromethanicus TaxID=518825 RepID=A0A9W6J6P3_9HYPH|nr:hypothetical protein GCM10017643_04390 [Ancylobacter dichloromethanicus]